MDGTNSTVAQRLKCSIVTEPNNAKYSASSGISCSFLMFLMATMVQLHWPTWYWDLYFKQKHIRTVVILISWLPAVLIWGFRCSTTSKWEPSERWSSDSDVSSSILYPRGTSDKIYNRTFSNACWRHKEINNFLLKIGSGSDSFLPFGWVNFQIFDLVGP